MLLFSGDVRLPVANRDVRASIASSAMCPSTSLLAIGYYYMRPVLLLIALCLSLPAEEKPFPSNPGSTAPQSGSASDLAKWGTEAFGGYCIFDYSDGVRHYRQISRCHTSGIRTSEDAVYESINGSFALLFSAANRHRRTTHNHHRRQSNSF